MRQLLIFIFAALVIASHTISSRAQELIAPTVEFLPPLNAIASEGPAPDVKLPDGVASTMAVPGETVVIKDEKIIYPWYYYRSWTGSFDLGANGSEGNSQSFNLRTGVNVKRENPWSITTMKADYIKTSSNSLDTANRLFFEGRHEWPFKDSRWSTYVHNTTEYDEFRAFDARVTFDGGLGYQILKNEVHSLKGRFGPGTSREFGGSNDEWTPELVFGLLYDWQISKKQKFNVVIDYFPDVGDFVNYRMNGQINWEVVLDEVNNLSLKIGIVDRYDSTSDGKKPNDLDYKTVIVWSF